jgi:beta propeller repeat protein
MATNSGFANIYLYDVASGTTTQVSRCACNETSPKIAGNLIVWEDDRNAASTGIDLYGVDLANIAAGDIAIDTEPGDQIFPDTDGTNVVFSDNRNGNYDVFLISVPRFTFHGFAAPLSNPPTVNAAKAGATVAVKWQLTDATGAFVSDLNAVVGIVYDMVSCAAFDAATSSDVPAVAAGGSGLRYDATANQYVYNWKTPWAAGCYALTVTLGDGSAHQADFKLK